MAGKLTSKEKEDTIEKIFNELRQYKKFSAISDDHLMNNIRNKISRIIEDSTNYEEYMKKLKEFIIEVRKFKEDRQIKKEKTTEAKNFFLSFENLLESKDVYEKIQRVEEQKISFGEQESYEQLSSHLERNSKYCFHFHIGHYRLLMSVKEMLDYQLNSNYKIFDENFFEKIKFHFQFLKYEKFNCKLFFMISWRKCLEENNFINLILPY